MCLRLFNSKLCAFVYSWKIGRGNGKYFSFIIISIDLLSLQYYSGRTYISIMYSYSSFNKTVIPHISSHFICKLNDYFKQQAAFERNLRTISTRTVFLVFLKLSSMIIDNGGAVNATQAP